MHIYSKRWIRFLLILPTLIFFTAYLVYPTIRSIVTSFFDEYHTANNGFFGIKNYIQLFEDEYFRKAVLNTVIIMCLNLIIILPLATVLALYLNKKFKGSEFIKIATITPFIMSGVMAGILWVYILDPGVGLLNAFLKQIGLGSLAFEWIGGLHLTPLSVSIVDSWRTVGYIAVIILAGLKMIPKDTLEASEIDGSNNFQRNFYVILPQLKETIKVCTVMLIIGGINTFQTVVMLTNGGPDHQSEVLSTMILRTAFNPGRSFGYGSAMAVIMLIMVSAFTVGFLRFTRKGVNE